MRTLLCCLAALTVTWAVAVPSGAQEPTLDMGLIEFRFVPTSRAQIALWLERDDGEFVTTVRLTEAVSYRGIGNRPGASQMNSGFRWPYGRREGVLPVWAHARASAPGAAQWKRVIFQDRLSEGLASRTSADHSPDDYYCLSFDRARSTRDALDAVSCASIFSSDKGRFLTQGDVSAGYAEPYEDVITGNGHMRALTVTSLYPPRRDVTHCGQNCYDHEDVKQFGQHARDVMPDIDAVTMATPVGGVRQRILFPVPQTWEPGLYRACIEVNVEGDYNERFDAMTFPTPTTPMDKWDTWAVGYGYPFRGQPSVVYCTELEIGAEGEETYATDLPAGSAGGWDIEAPDFGELRGMEGMTDDPDRAPGSGADRLHAMDSGYRFEAVVRPPLQCDDNAMPSAVGELQLREHGDRQNAHQWLVMSFRAAEDDGGVFRYEVRFSTDPITDDATFMAAQPAKNATIEAEELLLPTDAPAGEMVRAEMGGLVQQTHYFIAVRAVDACAAAGPIAVAELTTPEREFATVSPCFVATAAYGTPLAADIGLLRRMRDRHLMTNALGRALVDAYYRVGPSLATLVGGHEELRAAARWAIQPFVIAAAWLDS